MSAGRNYKRNEMKIGYNLSTAELLSSTSDGRHGNWK